MRAFVASWGSASFTTFTVGTGNASTLELTISVIFRVALNGPCRAYYAELIIAACVLLVSCRADSTVVAFGTIVVIICHRSLNVWQFSDGAELSIWANLTVTEGDSHLIRIELACTTGELAATTFWTIISDFANVSSGAIGSCYTRILITRCCWICSAFTVETFCALEIGVMTFLPRVRTVEAPLTALHHRVSQFTIVSLLAHVAIGQSGGNS